MAMDFFEHQEVARRNTGRLILLFVLAVIGLVVSLYLLVVVLFGFVGTEENQQFNPALLWQPELLLVVTVATGLLVGGGSAFKVAQLSGGGEVIAEHLGGRQINPDTKDPTLRKVLNVVEEMSIASGVTTPPVYLMEDENGINAFAAGYTTNDAVIGVTRGCVEQLSRDELQGVIAHEYSHILNGDMRMNIRLIGIIHGILIIGILGYYLFRIAAVSGHSRDSKNQGTAFMLLGLGMMAAGFLGTLFGNLIKAAVSRQREFLADASAVQFTRNPDGIANALKRIGGYPAGSQLESPNAPEASHMFFEEGVSGFSAMFATHPPLEERIQRIDENWKAMEAAGLTRASGTAHAGAAGFAGGGGGGGTAQVAAKAAPSEGAAVAATEQPQMASAMSSIGQPTEAHMAYAHELFESLPQPLVEAAHEPYGACAVLFGLLIDSNNEIRKQQLNYLLEHAGRNMAKLTHQLLCHLDEIRPEARLPLLDITLPSLREISQSQYEEFLKHLQQLIDADNKIDIFEWALQRIVTHRLNAHFYPKRPPSVLYRTLEPVESQVSILLSLLAYACGSHPQAVSEAFGQGQAHLQHLNLRLLEPKECNPKKLNAALDDLMRVAPNAKRQLILALAECVSADAEVTLSEGELLRAIAETLDCPMPPLLPGQKLV